VKVEFERIAVLGLGVMGGSLVRALASHARPSVVTGWSPDPSERHAAVAEGVVSAAPDQWQDAVADVDLVVLVMPLVATCELLGEVGAAAPPDSVLMDLASLKAPVADAAHAAGLSARWVGCHPMAGSEQSGFGASAPGLFKGVRVWLVGHPDAEDAMTVAADLWTDLGAMPERIEAGRHDRLMALASQLPQLASTALVGVLADQGIDPKQLGPGGRDMTRLAGSSPGMWLDLLAHAPAELVDGLRRLSADVSELADDIEGGLLDRVSDRLERGRTWRRDP
jgi:prephenate dehydrogenase